MRFKLSKGYILSALLLALFSAGCGVWNNFTTYFNLYYNIADLFEQAELDIKNQKRPIFSTDEIVIPGNAVSNLNKVIEKASNLMQFHGETAFVDDALLIIGKCFYYQKNYLKANRKFTELATMPDTDLLLEAQLWIGKTQMSLKEYAKGTETLSKVIAQAMTEGEDEIVVEAYAELVRYRIKKEDYIQAISLINEMLSSIDNEEVKAEVNYELAKLYSKTKDYKSSIAALEQVFELSPTYDIEFMAQIELGRNYRFLKQFDKAERIYENLFREDKYKDKRDISHLELGLTFFENNKIPEAMDEFTYTDTAFTTTSSSGIARLKKGEIYQYHIVNYDSAALYYQRAFNSSAPMEYLSQAREKDELFRKYKYILSNVVDNRKLLKYALNDSLYISDSIMIADSIKVLQKIIMDSLELVQQNNPERGGQNNNPPTVSLKLPIRPVYSADSIKALCAKNELELGNLFFTEFNALDSAYKYYNNIVTEFPATWFYPNALFAIGSYYSSVSDSVKADSIFNFIYDNFKHNTIVNAAAEKLKKPLIDFDADSAKKLYVEAENLTNNGSQSASVLKYYEIFTKFPKSTIAPKALYAGGYVLENNLYLLDSAAVLYDSLMVKYPGTEYANKVIPKLMVYKQEKDRLQRAITDSLNKIALADSLSKFAVKDTLVSDTTIIASNIEENKTPVITQEEKKKEEKPTEIKTEVISNQQLQNQRRGRGRYPSH